jgi:hypothetical protein
MAAVTLTNEQFEALLSRLTVGTGRTADLTRFNRVYDGTDEVGPFLDALESYKAAAAVTDSVALQGLAMVLGGRAGQWWIGNKSQLTTWATAITALREAFGGGKPSNIVLRDMCQLRQKTGESAETFLIAMRALIAKLGYAIPATLEVDFCFNGLDPKIKEKLTHDNITTFNDLVKAVRAVEQQTLCSGVLNSSAPANNGTKIEKTRVETAGENSKENTGENVKRYDLRPRSSKFVCYGCGAPGVKLADCPYCKQRNAARMAEKKETALVSANNGEENSEDELGTVEFGRLQVPTHREMAFNCMVNGLPIDAVWDTGAALTFAGMQLERIIPGSRKVRKRSVTLALGDGQVTKVKARPLVHSIVIRGETFVTAIHVIPGADIPLTLGRDFMSKYSVALYRGGADWVIQRPERERENGPSAFPSQLLLSEVRSRAGSGQDGQFIKPHRPVNIDTSALIPTRHAMGDRDGVWRDFCRATTRAVRDGTWPVATADALVAEMKYLRDRDSLLLGAGQMDYQRLLNRQPRPTSRSSPVHREKKPPPKERVASIVELSSTELGPCKEQPSATATPRKVKPSESDLLAAAVNLNGIGSQVTTGCWNPYVHATGMVDSSVFDVAMERGSDPPPDSFRSDETFEENEKRHYMRFPGYYLLPEYTVSSGRVTTEESDRRSSIQQIYYTRRRKLRDRLTNFKMGKRNRVRKSCSWGDRLGQPQLQSGVGV